MEPLLSQRELEVLELVAAGSTNRESAAKLFISEATVKSHLLNIYAKSSTSTIARPRSRWPSDAGCCDRIGCEQTC
ncbi:regulatory LuxR family protein [Kribbella orskensis]|uniref:Regulatory LuxR family protein n=1 Tax=Kribbella orskensis TaxID=2512216 RepID=A0ABY2BYZ7_9ACTN|nr:MULTISPECIES: helix-turn-helix transcriptional regulator [Kribbella]TCN43964.1 regulatory LuxR family protein [Kribbella sp. VKM Ac-2500]TCO32258.1 regulatory LuxR family protein [Kribbella orskensis]